MQTGMPTKTSRTASTRKRKPARKRQPASSKGLTVAEIVDVPDDARRFAETIRADGGEVIGMYRDPLGGQPVVVAALPIEKVEPTPYQRDRSEAHVKKLADAMDRVGRFLDPIIAVRRNGTYWTPNGNHRLARDDPAGHEVDHGARGARRARSRCRSSRSTPRRRTT